MAEPFDLVAALAERLTDAHHEQDERPIEVSLGGGAQRYEQRTASARGGLDGTAVELAYRRFYFHGEAQGMPDYTEVVPGLRLEATIRPANFWDTFRRSFRIKDAVEGTHPLYRQYVVMPGSTRFGAFDEDTSNALFDLVAGHEACDLQLRGEAGLVGIYPVMHLPTVDALEALIREQVAAGQRLAETATSRRT